MIWLFLAILLHALVDYVAGTLLQAFGQSIPTTLPGEGIVCVFGLFSWWIIWTSVDRFDFIHEVLDHAIGPGHAASVSHTSLCQVRIRLDVLP
ncbi:MAG TPA: hypothetical protein VF844_15195 [Ktedonobacteraceae bacterium]